MKLNPQVQIILNILSDNQWHCPIEWKYADGHCKRITDINEYLKPLGKKVDSTTCDCGRHTSKGVKKRKIINMGAYSDRGSGLPVKQPGFVPSVGATPTAPTKFRKDTCAKDYRCYSYRKFKVCSCVRVEVKDINNIGTLW